MPNNLILSASSATYFNFIKGLILSLQPAKQDVSFDIALWDIGLNPEQLVWLEQYVTVVKKAEWKFGLTDADKLSVAYKAILSRPFIPEEFPGYDNYLYIDADAWVQDKQVISNYLQAASIASIAIAPEVDRAYSCHYHDRDEYHAFVKECYSACVGEERAGFYQNCPIINAGVFALPSHSKIWKQWETNLARSLTVTKHHCVEQTSLNMAIFDNYDLACPTQVQLMPATHNWLCHLCFPSYDETTKQWVTPFLPHEKIGILHRSSDAFKTAEYVTVKTTQGDARRMNLKFQEGAYEAGASTGAKDKFDWQSRAGKKF